MSLSPPVQLARRLQVQWGRSSVDPGFIRVSSDGRSAWVEDVSSYFAVYVPDSSAVFFYPDESAPSDRATVIASASVKTGRRLWTSNIPAHVWGRSYRPVGAAGYLLLTTLSGRWSGVRAREPVYWPEVLADYDICAVRVSDGHLVRHSTAAMVGFPMWTDGRFFADVRVGPFSGRPSALPDLRSMQLDGEFVIGRFNSRGKNLQLYFEIRRVHSFTSIWSKRLTGVGGKNELPVVTRLAGGRVRFSRVGWDYPTPVSRFVPVGRAAIVEVPARIAGLLRLPHQYVGVHAPGNVFAQK